MGAAGRPWNAPRKAQITAENFVQTVKQRGERPILHRGTSKRHPVHKENVGESLMVSLDFAPKEKGAGGYPRRPSLLVLARLSALQLGHDLFEETEQHG